MNVMKWRKKEHKQKIEVGAFGLAPSGVHEITKERKHANETALNSFFCIIVAEIARNLK